MSNFSAAKVGGWSFGQKLASWQLTQLQEMLLKCPNFSEGSSHTLTGVLSIGATGAGNVTISAPLTLSGTNTVSGATTFTGTTDTQGLELHSGIVYDGITANANVSTYKRDIWVRASTSGITLFSAFDSLVPIGTQYNVYNFGSINPVNFKPNPNGSAATIQPYSSVCFRKIDNTNSSGSYIDVFMNF